jgi:hypothetical protein
VSGQSGLPQGNHKLCKRKKSKNKSTGSKGDFEVPVFQAGKKGSTRLNSTILAFANRGLPGTS